jgi:thiol-disulfide isomerase/thioredoxin
VAVWNLGLSLRHTHRRAALVKSMVRSNPRAIERLEQSKGSVYVERMLAFDTAKVEREREGMLERIADEFADIEFIEGGKKRQLGKMAEALLEGTRTLAIGRKVPEAESETLDGKKVKLSDYKGKVVVLNFWATWCGPCRALIPHERKLVEKMKGRPFAFISVSADEERETVQQFMAQQPMPWVHWWNGPTGDLMDSWHVSGFPTIYVIDARGFLRFEDVRGDDMDRAVEKLVREAEEGK